MAQLLYSRQSTNVHLNAVKRHMRLCRQIKGGEVYATRIEPFYVALEEKQKLSEEAKLNKEAAYDDVLLCDGDLDNSIRTLFDKCKQYDRENPGRPILNQLFTDGKLSTIIYAPLGEEPDMAEQLLTRLASLGAEHELAGESEKIKANIEKCKSALAAYHDAIRKQKSEEANEEIAKSNLEKQYEFNYLDSVKEFGKRNASRFFPVISSSSRNNVNADEKDNNE